MTHNKIIGYVVMVSAILQSNALSQRPTGHIINTTPYTIQASVYTNSGTPDQKAVGPLRVEPYSAHPYWFTKTIWGSLLRVHGYVLHDDIKQRNYAGSFESSIGHQGGDWIIYSDEDDFGVTNI